MARLYADENFPLNVVEVLRSLGHSVLTAHESGHANQAIPDKEILLFATQCQRALLTLNRRHFIRLHHESPDHAGIVVCTFDLDFLGQAHRIHAAIKAEGVLAGKLLRVNRPA